MPKRKLQRFAENATFRHVIESSASDLLKGHFNLRGNWKTFFGNDHPLVTELGCGRGEYTIGMARKFPGKNFIGIDIKGARLWFGAKAILENDIKNAALLRSRIDFIALLFGPNELDEIWITFPDPQPQKPRERKRLTSPRFLNKYLKVLKPDGKIHLKTDNIHFFEYTLDVIRKNDLRLHHAENDIHNSEEIKKELPALTEIQTHYESIFLEQEIPIHYLSFSLNGIELDESESTAIPEVTYRSRSR